MKVFGWLILTAMSLYIVGCLVLAVWGGIIDGVLPLAIFPSLFAAMFGVFWWLMWEELRGR